MTNKLIPLYLNPAKKDKVLYGRYSSEHVNYFSFYNYFFENKKEKLINKKLSSLFKNSTEKKVPAAFIFHAGRTGSTVMVQMLKRISNVEVFSEIDILTQVLSPCADFNKTQKIRATKNIINQYMGCISDEKKCVLKFTSIDVLSITLLSEIYPEVPCLFIFDDPQRIVSSQFLRPPGWARELDEMCNIYKWKKSDQSRSLFKKSISQLSFILNKEFEAALSCPKKLPLLMINYEKLFIESNIKKIFWWMNISVDSKDLKSILRSLKYDAKKPHLKFSAKKRKKTTPLIDTEYFWKFKAIMKNYRKLAKVADGQFRKKLTHSNMA